MQEKIKVWDPPVRIFHWLLVLLFTVSYLTGEEESRAHIYVGYGVLALLLFRIVWGVIGSHHARFSDFLAGPSAVLCYARALLKGKPPRFIGHNPLGGWMIILLLLSLSLSVWSGLKLYATEGQGPLAGQSLLIASSVADDDDDDKFDPAHEFWEEAHEFFANFTVLLVFLHVSGVLAASWLHRENLIMAMITGYKKSDGGNEKRAENSK
jgi:cytochrome b